MTGGGRSFLEAREALAHAPHDATLLYACCAAAGDEAESEMIALLEQRLSSLPGPREIRLHDRHLLARLREKRARALAGLHPTNASDFQDLFFRFAHTELAALANDAVAFLRENRTSLAAAVLLAEAHAAVGAFSQGERLFTQLRRTSGENVAAVTNFDPTFHAGLEAEANRGTADLPTVLDSRAVDRSNDLIVFAAADFHYFQRFGRRFVESFVRSGGGSARLALHIFDVTDEERVGIIRWLGEHGELRWSLSSEWTGLRGGDEAAAKGYYHAARFEVRNKIMACCAGFSNTREAHDYLRNVAGYICHYQREGRLLWGIDQVALFAVAAMGPPAVAARIKGVSDRICSPAARSGQILRPAKVG